jgi:adenylate kinase family enzyme
MQGRNWKGTFQSPSSHRGSPAYAGPVRRLIVGNSGSGKSTYAACSARAHGLASLELDSIVWEPHKVAVARPADDVRADLRSFLATHQRWVIEGCDGDLVLAALHACTELLFLNPGVAVCLEDNRRRPWEPHKYMAPEEQARMLPHLLAWVAEYYTRDGPRSYAFHRRLFDGYSGVKREMTEGTVER